MRFACVVRNPIFVRNARGNLEILKTLAGRLAFVLIHMKYILVPLIEPEKSSISKI